MFALILVVGLLAVSFVSFMGQLQSMFYTLQVAWPTILPVLLLISSALATLTAKVTNHPTASNVLHKILGAFSWAEHQNVGGWKWPFQPFTAPVVGSPVSKTAGGPPVLKALLIGALLAAAPARAQVVSTGLSLPMLEFKPGVAEPVSFAPGLGYELAVGFLQRSLAGKQYDLLDLSIQGFGSVSASPSGVAAGALQVALLVGTFNNLVAIGAAVPLYSSDGVGAFQGAFRVYPVLSLSIPLSFGPYSPPTGIEPGALGLPRGGTLYL